MTRRDMNPRDMMQIRIAAREGPTGCEGFLKTAFRCPLAACPTLKARAASEAR